MEDSVWDVRGAEAKRQPEQWSMALNTNILTLGKGNTMLTYVNAANIFNVQ